MHGAVWLEMDELWGKKAGVAGLGNDDLLLGRHISSCEEFLGSRHPAPPTVSRFVPARRTEADNTTKGRYFRYEIQPEHDDYFGHQDTCRADLESMFNTTRDVGGRKKDIIFLIGIVMREKCDPATQRLNHSCWTFASNPKGKAAPWFFGTNWWGGSPTRQPDNYRNEGQRCAYYISSIWPGRTSQYQLRAHPAARRRG
ncbi:unnamed protein product [Vitrella brassicaformis CCMP3155]|uniref:Uncharacterized protein n=1 Tax=Vitrella brassicaformis (strain CCMP3155) TaxID=1169540 RepID=A0A0G4H1L1_VITBC|nr:unnamed protein product [Vitrella brassicaformis CCMP3155]|eukprot:CEM37490.1 unnamed protein product [Vitrella brassicaformis CCMP3155]